ncbi:hypothetical protein [Amaricoccus sp.]|uniref:hypothetical protein n=1 Tax=Amaricoccus sp. TaxID=1872485 RepID=UPI0026045215|nr:hypothetical protein [Amaricoccus sp.]HRO11898.1 hypothetical protein [Amaricoccus sp.]
MLWSVVLVGVLGALIGLRYRAPVLMPATLVALVWGVVAGWMAQGSVGQLALMAIVLAVVLHAAYLAALALRIFCRRFLR